MERHSGVNQAIEQILGLWWSEDKEKAILEAFGKEVLADVRTVYVFAVKYPHDPAKTSLEEAYARVQESLRSDFPFLSPTSVRRLANCFAFNWK